MVKELIKLLHSGAQANQNDRYRRHNLIIMPNTGDLVTAGDIHGHRRNFERIIAYAALDKNPDRHLILQEIIHGGPQDEEGGCLSFDLLIDAVKLKVAYPDRVHCILANHDTAFINDSDVMKAGKEMNALMRAAMRRRFDSWTKNVESAIEQFLFSQPLAVRCLNRIWISHSLPSDRSIDKFDFSVFHRMLKVSDIVKPNAAYLLTWGRAHSRKTIDFFAKQLDVDFFVLGHQLQETGWMSNNANLIIIDSQHNHGHLLHIRLDSKYTIEKLIGSLVPIASIE
ncbi:MAG: metallophosphoesterase [Sedimentisphaerales bacterium]